jgi:hypothetical protein
MPEISIKYRGWFAAIADAPSRTQSTYINQVYKPALKEALRLWFNARFMRRFTNQGEYKFKPRAFSTRERKKRQRKGNLALVDEGELMMLSQATRRIGVRRPRKQMAIDGFIRLPGARKINRMRPEIRQQIKEELYQFNKRDESIILGYFEKEILRLMRNPPNKTLKRAFRK